VAVLTDADGLDRLRGRDVDLPVILVEAPRSRLGALAAWFYGRPAERLRTLGVTGTNGKTTTTFLLDGALRALGHRTGLIGTVELRIGSESVASSGTTPEAPDLHALLAVMLESGVDVCSMEISSHALAQRRVDGLTVDVAGFTNLSRDHLDYHHTMEEYFAAKSVLFGSRFAHRAVVCVDDPWGRRLADETRRTGVPVITMATRPPTSGVPAAEPGPAVPGERHWQVVETAVGRSSTVRALLQVTSGARAGQDPPPPETVMLSVPLPGEFNVANAVLATAMLTEAMGVTAAEAAAAVGGAGPVPGRMERVEPAPGAVGVPLGVVDYAHTPQAVSLALAALRSTAKPLVVVLGAGGDRDRDKRPLMGAAAAAAADVVVVTDDNPRSEDPASIRAGVLDGARREAAVSGADVREVPDRRRAIAEAVEAAWTDAGTGVVLVAGKGHEPGQERVVDGVSQVQPFDDRQVLREVLEHTR
jgi:UDP-N-acetylmuramoyl-L-alanyl-D-glutamate--2,6-diaminopimelate ligase